MTALFRRIKALYAVYNFFHRKELLHNVPLLKKYGIKKKYYSSISSRDFTGIDPTTLTAPTKPELSNTAFYREASPENQQSISSFEQNGFLIIRNYLSAEQINHVNDTISFLLKTKKIKFRYGNKIMFAIHHSALLRSIGEDKKLLEFLSCLMNGEAVLFQSINFIMGSEQRTHSDSIHMTTFPEGGLLGVWIALDDINEHNGPLHYYPGSQHLPYYLNADYDNEGSSLLLGKHSYTEYEEMIKNKIAENGLKKQIFIAKKGDMLVWHANLFHGGEPHTDKNITRRSMVLHYFNKNAICFHEITQRPALLKNNR